MRYARCLKIRKWCDLIYGWPWWTFWQFVISPWRIFTALNSIAMKNWWNDRQQQQHNQDWETTSSSYATRRLKIILFLHESEFYMSLALFWGIQHLFCAKFSNFHFLATKFPLITKFIPWPLAAKVAIKWDYFGYLWTPKDQNIYLRSDLRHLELFWQV